MILGEFVMVLSEHLFYMMFWTIDGRAYYNAADQAGVTWKFVI